MIAEKIPEIGRLSREDKLLLASELWEECADIKPDPARDKAIEKLLKSRWEEYQRNPDDVIAWEEMKKKYGLEPDE